MQVQGVYGEEATASVRANELRTLRLDLEMELNALRNVAYANGYNAAREELGGQM